MHARRIAASLVVLGLFGCANAPDPEPPVETGRLGSLALDGELSGRTVETSESGPWSYRRLASAGEGSDSGEKLALEGRGGSRTLRASGGGAVDGDFRARTEHSFDLGGEPGEAGEGGGGGGAGVAEPLIKDAKVADRAGPPPGEAPAEPTPETEELDLEDAAFEGSLSTASSKGGVRHIRPTPSPTQARQLKAGATDDNADYDAYLEFLAEWGQKDVVQAGYQYLDVSERRYIRVVDAASNPVPGAVVAVVDVERDRLVSTGTTYGDGRTPFYPNLRGTAAGDEIRRPATGYLVEARLGSLRSRAMWDAAEAELVLELEEVVPLVDPLQLDVLFLIDTTGSMGDEIASIKASLLQVTQQLRSLGREFDLRYGAVLFRDLGDEYVTATHEFTPDIEAFDKALQSVRANGGGDGPESVNQGLAHSVDGVTWRDGAAKVCFLIGDAPPHMDYPGDVWYGESIQAAVAKGIRIHSVAASGLDERGTLVWRQVAQFTRGKFIFIEYGSTAASAASHGVKGKVKSNNLEDILFEQIRDEMAHWGRDVE